MDAQITEWKLDEKQDIYILYYAYFRECYYFKEIHTKIFEGGRDRENLTSVNLKLFQNQLKMDE